MKDLLAKWQNFEECVLLDIQWRQWGFCIELVFNHIWAEAGVLRKNLQQASRVVIQLRGVQDIHVFSDWNAAVMRNPEELDWGSSAVALVRLEECDETLRTHATPPITFHRLSVLWEQDRRIDVVFTDMKIVKEE